MATDKEIKFLQDNFDFAGLKQAKFFDKNIKANDYDLQKERICKYFGLNSIFEYNLIGIEATKYITPELETFSEN